MYVTCDIAGCSIAFSVTVPGPGTVSVERFVVDAVERYSSPTRNVNVDAEHG
jgi:hypothetical protein